MSNTTILYGYGFVVDHIEAQSLKSFVLTHLQNDPSIDIEQLRQLDLDNDIFMHLEEHSCASSGEEGACSVISTAMYNENDIGFEYHKSNCSEKSAILLCETYPWNYTETEKNLTEQKLEEICMKYMKELNIEGKPGFLEIKFC